VETGNFAYIKEIVARDYSTFAGRMLEKFYRELFAESGRYNRIGSYWEKGNRNEIDLVAVNDLKKEIVLAEIKLDKSRIRLTELSRKAQGLLAAYPGHKAEWLGLGLEDAGKYLE
jgi:hypothetical protein